MALLVKVEALLLFSRVMTSDRGTVMVLRGVDAPGKGAEGGRREGDRKDPRRGGYARAKRRRKETKMDYSRIALGNREGGTVLGRPKIGLARIHKWVAEASKCSLTPSRRCI